MGAAWTSSARSRFHPSRTSSADGDLGRRLRHDARRASDPGPARLGHLVTRCVRTRGLVHRRAASAPPPRHRLSEDHRWRCSEPDRRLLRGNHAKTVRMWFQPFPTPSTAPASLRSRRSHVGTYAPVCFARLNRRTCLTPRGTLERGTSDSVPPASEPRLIRGRSRSRQDRQPSWDLVHVKERSPRRTSPR